MPRSIRRRRRRRIAALAIVIGIVATYLLGPRPDYPDIDPEIKALALPVDKVEEFVAAQEAKVEYLKPDNQSRIIWAGDSAAMTEYSIVFLHGFSASPMSGDPVVVNLARRYGCNLYMPRLAGHGLSTKETFANLTPNDLVQSAADALALGKVIGKKTIVIGSSTGATLALYLAAHNPDYVDALLVYSPNIKLYNKTSVLLNNPWGLQIARMVVGDYREVEPWEEEGQAEYWSMTYRTEGIVALKVLMDETMTEETFAAIKQPVYMAYYFKDEDNRDKVISIEAAREAFAQLATPEGDKREVALPEIECHAMLNRFRPKKLNHLYLTTFEFVQNVLQLDPVDNENNTP